MEEQIRDTGGVLGYILDKVFHWIMVLLYGARPSEAKAQKLTRWGVVLFTIVGTVVFFVVIRAMFFKPAATRHRMRPPTFAPPTMEPRRPPMGPPMRPPTR